MIRWLWAALALLALSALEPAAAQEAATARFMVEASSAPLVGEPVKLILAALLPAGATISQWPEFPQQWPPFETAQAADVRLVEQPDGRIEARQEITVILWAAGDYRTPETRISYQLLGMTPVEMVVEPAFLTVPSALTGETPALRPLKPQIALAGGLPPLAIVGGVAGAGALAAAAWRRRQRRRGQRPAAALLSAYDAALAGLQSLAERSLPDAQVYTGVAEQLRVYVSGRTGVQAGDLTTPELLAAVSGRIAEPQRQELARLLGQADLVKFARYQPEPRSAQLYVGLAQRWVKATEGALRADAAEEG